MKLPDGTASATGVSPGPLKHNAHVPSPMELFLQGTQGTLTKAGSPALRAVLVFLGAAAYPCGGTGRLCAMSWLV